MDASAIVAIVAADISLAALVAAAQQARSAKDQATSAREQVAEAQSQTALQRQMHRDAAQPYVWVDVRPDDGHGQLIKVVLQNGGPTVATDIRVTFTPPLWTAAAGPVSTSPGWTMGSPPSHRDAG